MIDITKVKITPDDLTLSDQFDLDLLAIKHKFKKYKKLFIRKFPEEFDICKQIVLFGYIPVGIIGIVHTQWGYTNVHTTEINPVFIGTGVSYNLLSNSIEFLQSNFITCIINFENSFSIFRRLKSKSTVFSEIDMDNRRIITITYSRDKIEKLVDYRMISFNIACWYWNKCIEVYNQYFKESYMEVLSYTSYYRRKFGIYNPDIDNCIKNRRFL